MSAERFDDRFYQFARNARWGTCADCPRDSEGHAFPEFCMNTERSDHRLGIDGLADSFTCRRIMARAAGEDI